jgi:hypothetical protein
MELATASLLMRPASAEAGSVPGVSREAENVSRLRYRALSYLRDRLNAGLEEHA